MPAVSHNSSGNTANLPAQWLLSWLSQLFRECCTFTYKLFENVQGSIYVVVSILC